MYKVYCDGSFNSAATVVIRGVGSVGSNALVKFHI